MDYFSSIIKICVESSNNSADSSFNFKNYNNAKVPIHVGGISTIRGDHEFIFQDKFANQPIVFQTASQIKELMRSGMFNT